MKVTNAGEVLATNKLQLIQSFRAIAAILVVCYHTGTLFASNLNILVFNNAFKFAHTGVTFFFVLSGFIIYLVHNKDIGNKEKFIDFLYKRFTRVYPLYWVLLAIKIIAKPIGLLAFIYSIFLIPVKNTYINVSWTLSFEIFFYVGFSLMIYSRSKFLKSFYLLFILILVVRFFLSILSIDLGFSFNFLFSFITSFHIFEFLMGIVAAHVVVNGTAVKHRKTILLSGCISFLLCSVASVVIVNKIAINLYPHCSPYQQAEKISSFLEYYHPIFFGVPSMLIVIGGAHIDKIEKISIPRSLLFIGDASYSIYLFHATIINLITSKMSNLDLTSGSYSYTIIPTILIAIFSGCIVHLFIERPLLKFLKKFNVNNGS